MQSILLLLPSSSTASREKTAGVYRYLDSSRWNAQLIEAVIGASNIRELIRKWKPAGFIVDRGLSTARLPLRLFAGTPTVYIDQDYLAPGEKVWRILHDSVATTRAAFDELHHLKPVHYAFLRDSRNTFWNRQREEAFRAMAAATGAGCTVLSNTVDLMERLLALPKPCGLLGSIDDCARQAINAANKGGLAIPHDLQVIGIGNDAFICEHSNPTLSSVHPDFEGCGYLAMATLDRIINGTATQPKTILYGPKETIRRSSTRPLGHYDARVIRALDFITARYADPNLSTETIAAVMGCSRSTADLRFRQSAGQSIREHIRQVRLNAALRLLKGSSYELKAVPSLCGYRSATTFMRTFKAATGLTMQEWQKTMSPAKSD